MGHPSNMQKLTPRQQDVLRLLAKEGAYINCKRQGNARRWNCYISQSIPPDANNKHTRTGSLGATTIELVDALQGQGLIGIQAGAQYFDSEWVITKAGLALLGLTGPENAAYEPRVYGFYRLARPDRFYQVTDRRDGTLVYSGSETIALMMAKSLQHPFTDEHRASCSECNAPDTFDHSAPQPSTLAGISDPEPDTAWCNNCKAQVAIEPCDNFQAAGETLVCHSCGSADLNFNATFTTYPTPDEEGRAQEAVKGIQQIVTNHLHAESDISEQRAFSAGLMARHAAKADLAGYEFYLAGQREPGNVGRALEVLEAIQTFWNEDPNRPVVLSPYARLMDDERDIRTWVTAALTALGRGR